MQTNKNREKYILLSVQIDTKFSVLMCCVTMLTCYLLADIMCSIFFFVN